MSSGWRPVLGWDDLQPGEPTHRRRRMRIGLIIAAVLVVLLGTVTAVALTHGGKHAPTAAPATHASLSSPPSTSASASATRTALATHSTHPRPSTSAHKTTPPPTHRSTPRPAPSKHAAGAVAVVPKTLAHPPPAAPAVALTVASEEVGLVDVISTLGFQNELAEGTGMLLNSSGAVLTNNHVVRDATSISVVVVNTGVTYQATVVGTDPSADFAVVQIAGSPHTQVAPFGDSATVKVGDKVTGVGNAGGRGGTPTAAPGSVTALHQSLTATDENGANPEHLTDMIASNAQIQPGDSGGPLFDAHARVVGMDTAGGTADNGEIVAFSIPIDTALSVASEIEHGQASGTVHIGAPASLGASYTDGAQGAIVQRVLPGSPADTAGIRAGDVITALGSASINSATALDDALATHKPGDRVPVTWTQAGLLGSQSLSATITLASGPAD